MTKKLRGWFLLSKHLSLPLRECMERVDYGEYRLWMRHLQDEWNQPSLSDYYLMQIAQEVRRVLSKSKNKIKLKHFLLNFSKPKSSEDKMQQNKTAIKSLLSGFRENIRRRKG